MFKKLFEPEYGPVAPEVNILAPQIMDMSAPTVWRAQSNAESCASMNALMRSCNCYGEIMRIRTEEVYVENGATPVHARIYSPIKNDGALMLFCHGGSFSMNNPDVYDYVTRYLARFGNMTVISVDYSLAPEYKFPIGLEESYRVLEWAYRNMGKLNAEKLVVCGDSSGGNFAAVLSLMARDRKTVNVDKQVLIYPVAIQRLDERPESERHYGEGYFLEYDSTKDPMGHYFGNETDWKDPYASPLLAEDFTGLPKACIVSAECDPLLDQALFYGQKLAEAGVEVEHHLYKGMIHGFICMTYGKTFDCLNDICSFVNS